ncbi:MAG: sigma factor, partial [Solirubrobacteraceae bacterium]
MGTAIKTRLLGSQSDEKLLELARDRSQTAWQTLARRHHGLLLRHCRGLCLSEEMAQEVVRRALSEAWRGIEAGVQPRELRPWLHRIAHWIAVEELEITGLLPGREGGAGAPGQSGAVVDGAPKPDELLALRGALRAMTPDRSREGIVVHRSNGNKAKVVAEDAFEFTDSAVRGLLGRARRGISALTPPPLLAWAMG